MARYKDDPAKRWALPDRAFFGHGACHILAGMFLRLYPQTGFVAKQIIPHGGLPGGHIFVAKAGISFDFHGYAVEAKLLHHHHRQWKKPYPDWDADICLVDFDLFNTRELNNRKMRGPDQFLFDPLSRARQYLEKIEHEKAYCKAVDLIVR